LRYNIGAHISAVLQNNGRGETRLSRSGETSDYIDEGTCYASFKMRRTYSDISRGASAPQQGKPMGSGFKVGVVVFVKVTLSVLFAGAALASANPLMRVQANATTGQASVTIDLPADADPNSLLVKINGVTIPDRFYRSNCGAGTCVAARRTSADGLAGGKNVIAALAKNAQGNPFTARARFDAATTSAPQATHMKAMQIGPTAQALEGTVSTPFLPPTVVRKSLNDGGYSRSSAWMQVGKQQPRPLVQTDSASSGRATNLDLQVTAGRLLLAAQAPPIRTALCPYSASLLAPDCRPLYHAPP
jgi:hypothetical protein